MSGTFDRAEHCRQIGFKPGHIHTGNGRKKDSETLNVQYLAKKYTKEALAGLMEIGRNVKNKAADRITAYNAVLDRGWGKPVQPTDIKGSILSLNFDQLRELEQRLVAMPVIEAVAEPAEPLEVADCVSATHDIS
jgi:hypothetical protein